MRIERVLVVPIVAFILAGCTSPKPPDGPRGTVGTAPPTTASTRTVATKPVVDTTVVESTTTAPASTVPGEVGNYIGVAEAALAAHDELRRQQRLHPEAWSRNALLKVLTASYTDLTLDGFKQLAKSNRRYQKGSIDERVVLRIESSPEGPDRAFAIMCARNNGAEYDTKGTADPADDTLVQNTLDLASLAIPMKKEDGSWKRDGLQDGDPKACENIFS